MASETGSNGWRSAGVLIPLVRGREAGGDLGDAGVEGEAPADDGDQHADDDIEQPLEGGEALVNVFLELIEAPDEMAHGIDGLASGGAHGAV